MALNLSAPIQAQSLKPRIVVIGVGGAGGNAIDNMIQAQLDGVDFVAANTDAQALERSKAEHKIQLGREITQGLGAGAQPAIGQAAARESEDEINQYLENVNMLFITSGMGGGTGTGAAPVIAGLAREKGILTVGVVTKPFNFEGRQRMKLADQGIEELQKYVDTLIVIPNQNLFRVANENTTFVDAFATADEVLHSGVRGVTDLMVVPGHINLDFADIRTVMGEMGKAMMGTGEAEGEHRALVAAEAAISNPLLDDVTMRGARGVLINVTGGNDITLFEVDEAAERIRAEVDPDANIYFGSTFEESMNGKVRVTVVATGIDSEQAQATGNIPLHLNKVQKNTYDALDNVDNGANQNFDHVAQDSEASAEFEQTAHELAEPGLFDQGWADDMQDTIEQELGLNLKETQSELSEQETLSKSNSDDALVDIAEHEKQTESTDDSGVDGFGDAEEAKAAKDETAQSSTALASTAPASIANLAARMVEEANSNLNEIGSDQTQKLNEVQTSNTDNVASTQMPESVDDRQFQANQKGNNFFKRWKQNLEHSLNGTPAKPTQSEVIKQRKPNLAALDGGKHQDLNEGDDTLEQATSAEIEKELLEIPAFLRRQAN